MSEYKFSCPHCAQRLACDEAWLGQAINCPSCQQVIAVPSSVPPSPSASTPAEASHPGSALAAPPERVVPRATMRRTIVYVGLSLALLLAGLVASGVYQRFRAPTVETPVSRASHEPPVRAGARPLPGHPSQELDPARPQPRPTESALPALPVPAPVPAVVAPVSVTPLRFIPKGPGDTGGFTYRLENRAGKPIVQVVLNMDFRDADGVLESRVPHTRAQDLAANASTEEKNGAFFMSEMTRSVTFEVESVTFADRSHWSQLEAALAAAAPGPLSFIGHDAPARAEVLRLRPKNAQEGSLAYRLVNQSNKAIAQFELEVTCLDAAGNLVEKVPEGWNLHAARAIPPGGTFEPDLTFDREAYGSGKTHRVRITVQSLTFAGGEKWQREPAPAPRPAPVASQ